MDMSDIAAAIINTLAMNVDKFSTVHKMPQAWWADKAYHDAMECLENEIHIPEAEHSLAWQTATALVGIAIEFEDGEDPFWCDLGYKHCSTQDCQNCQPYKDAKINGEI